MVSEIRRTVHEATDLDTARDPVEVSPAGFFQMRQEIDGRDARRSLAIFNAEVNPKLSFVGFIAALRYYSNRDVGVFSIPEESISTNLYN